MTVFREKRIKSNLTQRELALKIGTDRSTIAKWETGESLPRADKLLRLSQILNCKVDELLKNQCKEVRRWTRQRNSN